jgi:hypothetical protein
MPPVARTLLIGLAAVVGLLVIAFAFVWLNGSRMLSATMTVPPETLEVPSDSATLARGAHLSHIWGCTDCHGSDLGGSLFIDGMPFARIAAPNLTPGGAGASYSDADFERAIRHGVGADGRLLMVMPSKEYSLASTEDVAAIIAHLRSVPAVDRTIEARELGPIGRMVGMGMKDELFTAYAIDHEQPHVASVEIGVTTEYGGYLANACTGCHAPDFAGRPTGPGMDVAAANLTPHDGTGLGSWEEADFIRVFREGVGPDGMPVDSAMPWYALDAMTDDELSALWMFLQTLEPIENAPAEQ